MPIYALWFGGASYGAPEPARDIERFDTTDDVHDALKDRYDNGHGFFQTFRYCNRPHESVLTPAVTTGSFMHVYRNLDVDDNGDVIVHDSDPDLVVKLDDDGRTYVRPS